MLNHFSSSTSTPTPGGSNSLKQEYSAKDDLTYKKSVLERNISPKMNSEIFGILLDCLLSESEGCLYRNELFDYFLLILRQKVPGRYKDFTSKDSEIENFLFKCNYLDYIGSYLSEISNQRFNPDILIQKIDSFPLEMKFTRLYVDDVEKYINFKTQNPDSVYKELTPERHAFLKGAITRALRTIYYCNGKLDPQLMSFTFARWLLIFNLQQDIQEYKIVNGIMESLIESASSGRMIQGHPILDENKLMLLLVNIFNVLKVKYVPGDCFSGFYNLSIAISKIDSHDLCRCVERYLMEILQAIGDKKETLGQIFLNLITMCFTSNTCSLIITFSEAFKANGIYDQLFYLFNEIVIPHCVPKLKIDRAFEDNLFLCQFFFAGFAGIAFNLPVTLRDHFIGLLQFYYSNGQRDSAMRRKLFKYVEFLDIVCYLYLQQQQSNNKWFEEIQNYLDEIHREMIKPQANLPEIARALVWQISQDDLQNQINLMANSTEKIHPKFKASTRYKGIRNIGNTCYIACTMQALFATTNFRQKILDLIEETHKKSGYKSYSAYEQQQDVLRETQDVFYKLDPRRDEPKIIDPKYFKEALPDQFRLANSEQDPSEFLKIYFDYLESRLKLTSNKDLVDNSFAGELLVGLRGEKCGRGKHKKEKFLDIVLNFSHNKKEDEKVDQIEMIKKAFEKEKLTDMACEFCDKKDVHKETRIEKMPPYLIMTLNRFRFDQVGMKLTTQVQIHQQLDLKQILYPVNGYSVTPSVYNLYAVLVHIGSSPEHGHYYVLIRDKEKHGWYMLNDAQCYFAEDLELSELFKQDSLETPYILFYEAVETRRF